MNGKPIFCNGNDLPQILADIRSRGGYPDRLETGFGSVAGYRVSYFERVVPTIASAAVFSAETANVLVAPTGPHHFAGEADSTSAGSVNPRKAAVHEPLKNVAGPVVVGEHTGNSDFVMRRDCSDATQTSTLHVSEGDEAVTPRGGELYQSNVSTRVSTKANTTEALGMGLAHSPHNDSIETRMAALQSRLTASGKLKRSKPSTPKEHARTPYKDD